MLPSMPILFTRESEDGFGNKIEPSTSFFNQNSFAKPAIKPEPPSHKVVSKQTTPKVIQNEIKNATVQNKVHVKESKIKEDALDAALVRSYYTKVQSRFASNHPVPVNKFVQFQGILKSFDPSKETPVDLYKKIEQLFGDEHKDIVEEFLLFLLPEQAEEIGRFMDHFMLVQITSFIEMLQNTFSRKPTVLRKILRALTTGLNSGNSNEVKTRVLPHLRSNPRLTQMFKSLFPDERPPDSLYETGTDIIHESFLTCDKGYDVWEFDENNDNKKKLDAKESLDTVYLHGRVFLQHGRMLRAAKVTFPYSKEPYRVHARRLAPAHCYISPSESEEETASPKRNNKNIPKIPPKKTKKQPKSPTKNIKDVNDNTKHKDCTPTTMNSPKTVRKQSNVRSKSCKEKRESENKLDTIVHKRDCKKEKHDGKNSTEQRKEEGSKAKQAKIEVASVVNVDKKTEMKNSSWTREEDKTMLQVLKGEAGSEQVFGRIRELLPHRSATEIKERVFHVMNLLQQMAVSEVT